MDENQQFQQPQEVKINLPKILIYGLLSAIILYGLFIFINERSDKVSESDIFEADFSKNCEAGKWISFPGDANKPNDSYKGKLILNEEGNLISEDGSRAFIVPEEYSLNYFTNRKVEIEGNKKSDREIQVQKIRCIGEETKPENVAFRRNLMNYAASNINNIAPEKPRKGKWAAEEFYFVDNNNFYVFYSSYDENDEDYEEDRLLLLRAREKNNPFGIEQLAYIIPSNEDEEAEVKFGEDIYKNQKDIIIYEYDDNEEQWLLAE